MVNEVTTLILFGVIVFLTHMQAGITGFGGTVLALPFAAMLLGLHEAVPALVFLGWLLVLYIVVRSRKDIQWKPFFFILIHTGIALPVGMFLFDRLPENLLKVILALFMVGVGVHGFLKNWRAKEPGQLPQASSHSIWMRLVLIAGGVIHGAFGTGGPFVVIYASRALPDKTLFRVTLSMLWVILATIMIVKWTVVGDVWTAPVIKLIGVGLPFLISGILLGDWLHHRVNERFFRLLVFSVLCASGVIMLHGVIK